MQKRIVLGITGASGVIYGIRLLNLLLDLEQEVHLVISPTAEQVLADELGGVEADDDPFCFLQNVLNRADSLWKFYTYDPDKDSEAPQALQGNLYIHRPDDYFAQIASGSFPTDGMVVCPCTGSTLGHIAAGINGHLIHRAAEVHLKELRPLILVLRETPLSSIHLKNLLEISQAGGTILPASPHFYGETDNALALIDSVVAKVLDQLRISHPLTNRWKDR